MATLPVVSADDVRVAAARIDRDGVPAGRGSTKFCVEIGGRHYPPKYIVALAGRRALGRDLRPDEFSGGVQTNSLLGALGFEVTACGCGGTRTTGAPTARPSDVGRTVKVEAHAGATRRPTIVRIVSRGRTPDDARAEERMLVDTFDKRWPNGVRTKFVLTPGGFVHGTWPARWRGRTGWASREVDIEPLFVEAERQRGCPGAC